MYQYANNITKYENEIYNYHAKIELGVNDYVITLVNNYISSGSVIQLAEFEKNVKAIIDNSFVIDRYKAGLFHQKEVLLEYIININTNINIGNSTERQLHQRIIQSTNAMIKSYYERYITIISNVHKLSKYNFTKKQKEMLKQLEQKAIKNECFEADKLKEKLEQKNDFTFEVIKLSTAVIADTLHNSKQKYNFLVKDRPKIKDTKRNNRVYSEYIKTSYVNFQSTGLKEQLYEIYDSNGINRVMFKHIGDDKPCPKCAKFVNKEFTLYQAKQIVLTKGYYGYEHSKQLEKDITHGASFSLKAIFHPHCHCWLIPHSQELIKKKLPLNQHINLKNAKQREADFKNKVKKMILDVEDSNNQYRLIMIPDIHKK